MVIRLLVKLSGGWWQHRNQTLQSRGLARRIMASLHKEYVESFGAYVSLLARFDGPPHLPHKLLGIFIAPGAVIGKDVTIYQQVTIGKNDLESSPRFGAPTIGDGVYIGAGAKVIGAVTIGAGAKIGAGAVVVTDVPEDATVVAAPVRVLRA